MAHCTYNWIYLDQRLVFVLGREYQSEIQRMESAGMLAFGNP